MTRFEEYLEESLSDKYVVATEHGINIDLGKHAKGRGTMRLGTSHEQLTAIGKKIANVFDKTKPDGLFGFYSHIEHISGIFRFFKGEMTIKFITVFPNKKVQYFNNIDGAIIFNESHDGMLVEGIPIEETIIDTIEV